MAAQALNFCSTFWGSSSSSSSFQHQQYLNTTTNPNTVTFHQRKRPRSLSTSNPNPNFLNPITPITPQYQTTNPFYNNNNNTLFPTDHLFAANPSFFDTPFSSPPPLHQDFSNYSSYSPDLDFSSPEDQILLAPFLAQPEQISTVDRVAAPEEKKQCNGGGVSAQSMAARERRRKITERTAELGKLIPGGNKMSTAEMFQSAYKYVKFMKAQLSLLQLLQSSNQGMKEEEQLHIKELQVLASPILQEKLYSQEKCLVPKSFLGRTLANHQELRRTLANHQ